MAALEEVALEEDLLEVVLAAAEALVVASEAEALAEAVLPVGGKTPAKVVLFISHRNNHQLIPQF